ncbi:homeobox protein 2-like [Bombyx mandarina]|uniref:Homeobox protein 2-like n=1 Tax=Bombyx mandarina TaxID=7092 RepID=A0A6J2K9F9_BOMMA|nr:homeobox protein 2-like [Bombyx mandarina]
MSQRRIYILFIALFYLYISAEAKKSKKNRRPYVDEETSTPQANVISYSAFGFNDVGSYDGFMPTSADYTGFSSAGVNQESSTRLYAPAFPTALDATDFGNNFATQAFDGVNDNDGQKSGVLQYNPNNFNYFNSQTFENSNDGHRNIGTVELYSEDRENPIYGTKIHKGKIREPTRFNYTENNTFPSQEIYQNYANMPMITDTHETTADGDTKSNNPDKNIQNQNSVNKFNTNENNAVQNTHNPIKFQKVVDFTNLKPHYPISFHSISTTTPRDIIDYGSLPHSHSGNAYENAVSENNSQMVKSGSNINGKYNFNKHININDDNAIFSNHYSLNSVTPNNNENEPYKKPIKSTESKKKIKEKPWFLNKNSTGIRNWKDLSHGKRYEYSNNNINMTFKYESNESRNPLNNIDEIVPASSNLVDLNYPQQQIFSTFKKMPEISFSDYSSIKSFKDSQQKLNDFSNAYRSQLSTTPSSSSYWGNTYEVTELPSFKKHPHFSDNLDDEIVSIPKRNKYHHYHSTPYENKPNYWPYGYHNPYKSSRPKDWNNEEPNRFKSEEDLLGLRNQDTSRPSYVPTYKPTAYSSSDDSDYYNKVVDRWRQSYLRSKYRDSNFRDYESLGTDTKALHIPVPKPYPIEVPHPVIVPVPQPYPVHVPVSRPVAVPVVHELQIPIEKPVPYPVIKKVPYPVEKPVPVTVEKEVTVPVVKPYPVHIPYVRPVFHNSKPSVEEFEYEQDDEEYVSRPQKEKKNVHYSRKPSNSRTRSRRPSRTVYEDHARRRWPDRRRPSSVEQSYRKHHEEEPQTRHRYRAYETSDNEYYYNCKRTRRC